MGIYKLLTMYAQNDVSVSEFIALDDSVVNENDSELPKPPSTGSRVRKRNRPCVTAPNAYQIFMTLETHNLKPDSTLDAIELKKHIGSRWKNMSVDQKQVYQKLASDKKNQNNDNRKSNQRMINEFLHQSSAETLLQCFTVIENLLPSKAIDRLYQHVVESSQ